MNSELLSLAKTFKRATLVGSAMGTFTTTKTTKKTKTT